ncbi:glycerophosphodiester phosphodiesterase family protein [Sphingomonas sp.]|uniref:glycerophosphodiester phosphodiesterase family protein n=1 Tax=Sphingomonas sp. TaxID=28214 RepID=UPI0017BC8E48|nr:glycerophosphodiester phosphodiesterase family protein [Sphingomonas sp.]MBA3510727.1 glycerophosphodiester phosphodiesterase [Sphingomonas sp.]
MKYWLGWTAFGLAVLLLLLTVINASWLADAPRGAIKLIAHRGVSQLYDHEGIGRDTCTADRIEPPVHDYLENSIRSMKAAARLGADMVEIDIAPTADGKIAVFHDWTVDCRTDGTGETRDRTLAQLKALDIGHGYTADHGRSFPFRGTRKDRLPSLDEALAALPNTSILFNFKSRNPGEADRLAAALKAARRDIEERNDAFYGAKGPVERIKRHFPDAWAWSMEDAKACTKDYILTGWTTMVPQSCRDGTLMVPVNLQWLMWGWPNRLLQRMDKVGARVIVIGSYGSDTGAGLTLPEQLGRIPSSFTGYIWAEDIWTIGPALRPGRDFRTKAQEEAAKAGLERRRARME